MKLIVGNFYFSGRQADLRVAPPWELQEGLLHGSYIPYMQGDGVGPGGVAIPYRASLIIHTYRCMHDLEPIILT